VEDLQVGDGVRIGDDVEIAGGRIAIGDGSVIYDGCRIHVVHRLVVGRKSVIGSGAVISGKDIALGREFYSLSRFEIGGGSCFESLSRLKIGYWFHGGRDTFINTARAVEIGDEVGMRSSLYTHGAYLNVLDGFPEQWGEIHIGSNVWMPSATVHPNVRIGSNVVIGAGSIVTRDIPSNCLALGVPCRVVSEGCYPKPMDRSTARNRLLDILSAYGTGYMKPIVNVTENATIVLGDTVFDPFAKTIQGSCTPETELLRDRLRRHGIRFKVDVRGDNYEPWSAEDR
jgi:acetyltransferase-like isoleucine patch superfamily enzyme